MDINEFLKRNRINKGDVIYNMYKPSNPRVDLIELLTEFENELKNEFQATSQQSNN